MDNSAQIAILIQNIADLVQELKLENKQSTKTPYDESVQRARARSSVPEVSNVSPLLSVNEKKRYAETFDILKSALGISAGAIKIRSDAPLNVRLVAVTPNVFQAFAAFNKAQEPLVPEFHDEKKETPPKGGMGTALLALLGGAAGIGFLARTLDSLSTGLNRIVNISPVTLSAVGGAIGVFVLRVMRYALMVTPLKIAAFSGAILATGAAITAISYSINKWLIPGLLQISEEKWSTLLKSVGALAAGIGGIGLVISIIGKVGAMQGLAGVAILAGALLSINTLLIPGLQKLSELPAAETLKGIGVATAAIVAFGTLIGVIGALALPGAGIAFAGGLSVAGIFALVRYAGDTLGAIAPVFKQYESINANKLAEVGVGIAKFSGAMFGASIANASSALINKITSFFSSDTVTTFERFSNIGGGLKTTAESIKKLNENINSFGVSRFSTIASDIKKIYDTLNKGGRIDFIRSFGLSRGALSALSSVEQHLSKIAYYGRIIKGAFDVTNISQFISTADSAGMERVVNNFTQIKDALQVIKTTSGSNLGVNLKISSELVNPLVELQKTSIDIQKRQLDELVLNNRKMEQLMDRIDKIKVSESTQEGPGVFTDALQGFIDTYSNTRAGFMGGTV